LACDAAPAGAIVVAVEFGDSSSLSEQLAVIVRTSAMTTAFRRFTRASLPAALAVIVTGVSLGVGCGTTEPSVRFVTPRNGEVVRSPVRLEMAASGMKIEPLGPLRRNTGHFHVMIDRECFRPEAFVELHTDGFEHYGNGSSTAELDLPRGRHDLCLQVGNSSHVTLEPVDRITITVK
jgi:hypothetical protein